MSAGHCLTRDGYKRTPIIINESVAQNTSRTGDNIQCAGGKARLFKKLPDFEPDNR